MSERFFTIARQEGERVGEGKTGESSERLCDAHMRLAIGDGKE